MRHTIIGAAALAAVTLGAAQANAQGVYPTQTSFDSHITVINNTPGAIWATVYTVMGQEGNQEAFCVGRGQSGRSRKEFKAWPFLYVRAEIKRSDSCNAKTAYDSKNNYLRVNSGGGTSIAFKSSKVTDKPSITKVQ